MATAAAAAASRLIEAANRALVAARATASPDAVNTTRITASSGYRGQEHQARVWRDHFKGYYNDTFRARQALPGGPHSEAAVRYMLDDFKIPWKVAAPGYSNHQAGIAIDLLQKRNPRTPVRNSTKPYWRRRWQATWFFAWLNKNAASFGFRPYTKEEWHWEYKPGGAQREDEFSESAFEADEDFYGSEAEDESFPGEEKGDTEAAYEDEEAFADQSAGEDESIGLGAEDNERYDPETEEESSGECATCGRVNLESEDARYEVEEAEDQFAESEDTREAFEDEAPPIPVEKFFEVRKKGHKVAYRLAGRPEPRPFFYRAGMSTDYDGAPTAYHPRGSAAGALDHLANAGKPGNWWGIATTNGRRDGTPYIQQPGRPERDPNPGFYVSPTSMADTRFERTDTRRYVDATKVPYIALPVEAQDRGKKPLRGGAKLGDLAAVVNLKNGRVAYAIFADSGPRGKIGEGSAALGNALARKGSEELDLAYVIFPSSRKQPPWPLAVATIDREGARLFAQWGGVALVKRLVAPGMPLAKRPAAPAGPPRVSPATLPTAPETETGSETETEEDADRDDLETKPDDEDLSSEQIFAPEGDVEIGGDEAKLESEGVEPATEFDFEWEALADALDLSDQESHSGLTREVPKSLWRHNTDLDAPYSGGNYNFRYSGGSREAVITFNTHLSYRKSYSEADKRVFISNLERAVDVWDSAAEVQVKHIDGNYNERIKLRFKLTIVRDSKNSNKKTDIHPSGSRSTWFIGKDRETVMRELNVFIGSSRNVLVHELGHVWGLLDEYDTRWIEKKFSLGHVGTDSPLIKDKIAIMNEGYIDETGNTGEFRGRYFKHFGRAILSAFWGLKSYVIPIKHNGKVVARSVQGRIALLKKDIGGTAPCENDVLPFNPRLTVIQVAKT